MTSLTSFNYLKVSPLQQDSVWVCILCVCGVHVLVHVRACVVCMCVCVSVCVLSSPYLQSPPSGSRGWGCLARSSLPLSSRGHTGSGSPPRSPRGRYTCPGTAGRCRRCPGPRWAGPSRGSRSPDTSGTSQTYIEREEPGGNHPIRVGGPESFE